MKNMTRSKQQFNLTQQARLRLMLTTLICGAFGHAQALPIGEQVQAGSVGFARDAHSLNINQSSQKAIVNWQSFSIGANEAVRLNQPNQGVALFRVLGSDPSQIFGSLTATGSLFLSNPNGVLFGAGAQVDVGSLVATTMRMNDADFLNGHYRFFTNPNDPLGASVVNQGAIRTEDGGYIVLLGNTVENSGTLQANKGSVVLGSAQSTMLDFYGDGLVRVKLEGDALKAVINNTGSINADGGAVQLATNARTAAINVDGIIQANSLVERNGVIHLEGGKNAKVSVKGTLSAAGNEAGTTGGRVEVTGEQVALLKGAKLDASGNLGGGAVLVGGDYQGKNAQVFNSRTAYVDKDASINVDAKQNGNGGRAIVWSDNTTRFYGNISARGGALSGDGGFVETSGKNYLDFVGQVDTTAQYGNFGVLLLDPTNITISTGINSIESSGATIFQEATTATSILNTTTLQNALALNNVEVTTASPAASAGTITVSNAVTWASGNSLTLTANSSIVINAAITTGTAASSLILNATGNVTQSGTGIIGGAGGLTKNGAGTATLSLANTYTGATTINTGTLALNATGTIAQSTGVANNAAFTIAGNKTIDSMTGAGTTALGASTLTIGDASNTSSAYSGIISGTGGVTKAGTGTLTLSGGNTYTGATTIGAGSLVLSGGSAISDSSAVNLSTSGANLTLNNNETVGSIAGVAGTTVSLGANTLTAGGLNTNTTLTSVVSDTGGITKVGTGTLTLGGVNTYTGATTISSGTLALNATGTVAASSGVANNSAFSIAAAKTIDSMTGAGTTALGGVLTIGDASNTSSTYTGVASGAGGITTAGTGTLTLGGVNTYTGATVIGAGSTLALNAAGTIAASSGVANAGNFTIAGNKTIDSMTGAGTTALGANSLTIGDASNTTSTYSGVISGAGGITKAGAGTLTLSGTNSYTGTTTVSSGTLALGANNVLADTSSVVVNGGIFSVNTRTDTVAGVQLLSGSITGAAGGVLTSTSNYDLQSGAVSAALGGAVNLNKSTAGTVTISGANAYTGSTNVNAGTLTTNAAVPNNSAVTIAGGATLNLTALDVVGSVAGAGNVTLGAFTLTTGGDNTSTIFSGVASGTGGITKAGTGTFTLSGANTYTGATTINAGTLRLAGGAAIADTSAVTLANVAGATLDLNGANETIGSLAGGGATGGNVTLGAGTLTTGGNNTNTTYAGVISGTGGFAKIGAGTQTLSRSNTYTGTTTISAGTLTMGANDIFANTSSILVNGGTLDANTRTDTVAGVRLDSGAITGTTGALTSTSAYDLRSGSVSKILGGAVGLNKTTAGTVTLSGANTYTGATAINAGTLVASNGAALGAVGGGTTVASGATLNVNTVTLVESALNISGTGVASAGALTGTNAAVVSGAVTTAGVADTSIGTTSAASTLTLNGLVTATANNFGIVGAGNVVAINNGGNNFGTVNINGANNVSLRDTNAIILGNGASNLSGNLGLQTNGTITQTAGVTVGGATTLNAGATNNITLDNIANNFNTVAVTSGQNVSIVDANALTVNASTVGTITARTLSVDLTLGGNITATGAGDAIVLASGGNFINSSNSNLNPGTGRWLVYSASPSSDTRGASLEAAYDFKQYNTAFGGAISGSNDGFIYTIAPTITATLGGSAIKTYDGNTTAPVGSLTLGQSGAIDGDTVNLSALSSATYDNKNAGLNKTVSSNVLSIASATNGAKQVFGYTLASATATGNVGTINKADITAVTGITANNKTYDGNTNATLNTGAAGFTGIIFGETLTVGAATGTFNSKDVLAANTVNISGITLADGSGLASNYNLTNNTASAAANITTRPITVTANPGQSKVVGNVDPLPFTFTVGGPFGLVAGDTFVGALDRLPGETVGNYAINQGTLNAGSNYAMTYFGNNFSILAPSIGNGTSNGNPRNSAGLVDLNPALGNYTNQQLFVLNVGFTSAGIDSDGNQQACEGDPESFAKDKDFILMLNYGLKLPKGVNTSCDKASL